MREHTEGGKSMRYQVRVAGKIYSGNNPRILLKRAVEAWKTSPKPQITNEVNQETVESNYEELALNH